MYWWPNLILPLQLVKLLWLCWWAYQWCQSDRFASSYQEVRLGFVEELDVAVAVGFEKAMLD